MKFSFVFIVLFFFIKPLVCAEELLSKDITVYKNPECSCCDKWIIYLRKNKYNVEVITTRNVFAEKQRLGVPHEISACHTAVIGGYVVEGHVTHRDITRLLLFQPDVVGIAVPGMPMGTPGMERGDTVESYSVMSFDKIGNIKTFVKH
jgi:hypothetical protein